MCDSRYFPTQRSTHDISPRLRSVSLYRETHFSKQREHILLGFRGREEGKEGGVRDSSHTAAHRRKRNKDDEKQIKGRKEGKECRRHAYTHTTRSTHSNTHTSLSPRTYLLNRSEYILTSALAIFSCWLLAAGGWLPPPPPKKLLMLPVGGGALCGKRGRGRGRGEERGQEVDA